MRKKKIKRAVLGNERILKMFLLFPKTLKLTEGYEQTRFLEIAEVTQVYDGEKWIDNRWKQ